MRKKERSPQDKKALSYAKDRRNVYRENSKASRKLVPLRRAQASRQDRRKVTQELATLERLPDEAADLIESSARQDMNRIGAWKKRADAPLDTVVASKIKEREMRPVWNARRRAAEERRRARLDAATGGETRSAEARTCGEPSPD